MNEKQLGNTQTVFRYINSSCKAEEKVMFSVLSVGRTQREEQQGRFRADFRKSFSYDILLPLSGELQELFGTILACIVDQTFW